MVHLSERVRRGFGSLFVVFGIIGMVSLPEDLGAWGRLIGGVNSALVYVVAYGVIVGLVSRS